MSVAHATNGRPQRKQLADHLDRLDGLLDGLSEGLMGAVTDAVRDGTRLAVKDAIVEILTDPALRAKLNQAAGVAPAAAPAPVALPPTFWARMKNAAANAAMAVGQTLAAFWRKSQQVAEIVVETVRNPVWILRWIGDLRRLVMVAIATGLAVAIVSFLAPHVVSAALSGIAGGVAAMAVQASRWTRRAIDALA
jgi:hypothetical protein